MLNFFDATSQGFKRHWAPRMLVKKWKLKRKERAQEKQRSALNVGTHTTLRCCVARPVENPQKTGVLGSRQICRGLLKAPLCVARTYRGHLLSILYQ